MPRLIDTHAHLDADLYADDLDNMMHRAAMEGVWAISVGNDHASSQRAIEIANRYESGVYAAIGVHPLHIRDEMAAEDELMDIEKFSELAQDPKVVAIGETGLDYRDMPEVHRRHPDHARIEHAKDVQKKLFGRFLQLSQETRLPLLLHCRDAHEDMLEMLETHDRATSGHDARGVIHAFTGGWKEAKRYFNLGFLVSVTGLISYGAYRTEIIRKMPLNRLLLESECPHLTAIPWNLRRTEPAFMTTVADAIAGIRGVQREEVERATTENALRVFTRLPR